MRFASRNKQAKPQKSNHLHWELELELERVCRVDRPDEEQPWALALVVRLAPHRWTPRVVVACDGCEEGTEAVVTAWVVSTAAEAAWETAVAMDPLAVHCCSEEARHSDPVTRDPLQVWAFSWFAAVSSTEQQQEQESTDHHLCRWTLPLPCPLDCLLQLIVIGHNIWIRLQIFRSNSKRTWNSASQKKNCLEISLLLKIEVFQ